jgi:hypothetical protein
VTYQDDDSQIVIENFSADNQISSDEKINQIYADKEKNFIEVLVKLTKFITTAITDAESTLDKYKGRL